MQILENQAFFILHLSQLYPGVIIDAPPFPEVTLHHKTTAKTTRYGQLRYVPPSARSRARGTEDARHSQPS